LPYLQSIEPLDKANIIVTQNRPIIVHASDQNYYYCKYHNGHGVAYRLFKEFLVGSFLSFWELNHADVNFIEVLDEHIPIDLGIPKRCFLTPCFGSKKIIDCAELTKFTEDVLLKRKGRQNIKSDILRITFFDLIFTNEDRHLNNYNILYTQINNEYQLYPIDHEACFNQQNFDKEIYCLSYEDTLIYSPIFNKLFSNSEFNDKDRLDQIRDNYYLCYRRSIDNIEAILASVPESWQVNIEDARIKLERILTDDWFQECWREFLKYIQYFISNTH
jgi:hypothetical protein